jgi:hypothetical protein
MSPRPPGVPRITVYPSVETGAVRPPQDEGVEPPLGPGNSQIPADASDGTDNAPFARSGGLFDDIVPPRPGHAPQTLAEASDGTDNAAPARSGGLFDDIVPPAAPAFDMSASDGGQFAAPLPDGRNFRVVREGVSPPAAPKGFVANAADFAKSIPHGIVGGISSALSATGAAANAEMSQPEDPNPTPQEIRQALEQNVTGATHRPEGNAGKFGAAIGEALGTPTSYLGPGGLLAAILGAIGGEGGRQAAGGHQIRNASAAIGRSSRRHSRDEDAGRAAADRYHAAREASARRTATACKAAGQGGSAIGSDEVRGPRKRAFFV